MTITDNAAGLSWWADLPKELLSEIGHRFDFTIDVLRFRSVCSPWRSSIPSPYSENQQQKTETHHPVSVRLPFSANVTDGVLAPFTVYRMQFQPPIDGGSNSWLVKIQQSERGKFELVNPITNLKLRYSTLQLSSLDFNLVKLGSSFRLRYPCGYTSFEVNKAAPFPSSQFTVIAIFHEGKLGFWRKGDPSWTLLDGINFDYDDLIPYRGRFYVVDRSGEVSWINSSLEIIRSEIPPPEGGGGDGAGGGQKNLLESGGDLYMVDRYLDGPRRNWKDVEDAIHRFPEQVRYLVGTRRGRIWNPSAVDFKVYRMDEEIGRWVDVESVDGRVFVLTNECSFSFSNAGKKSGGDCIYYSDDDDYVARSMMRPESVRVFRFQDRSISRLPELLSPAAADFDFFRSPPALCLLA